MCWNCDKCAFIINKNHLPRRGTEEEELELSQLRNHKICYHVEEREENTPVAKISFGECRLKCARCVLKVGHEIDCKFFIPFTFCVLIRTKKTRKKCSTKKSNVFSSHLQRAHGQQPHQILLLSTKSSILINLMYFFCLAMLAHSNQLVQLIMLRINSEREKNCSITSISPTFSLFPFMLAFTIHLRWNAFVTIK